MATAPECLTAGQMKDLCSAVSQAVPGDFSRAKAEEWLRQKGKLGEMVRMVLQGCEVIPPDINWELTYKKLDMEVEWELVKGLALPKRRDLWVVPMAKGVTSNKIVRGHKKLGVDYFLYVDDLDTAVPTHDRDPNRDGSYLVGFNRAVEADEENAGSSADQLAQVKHKGNTLPERLLLGAGFYITTGLLLDVVNWTLCSGSRGSGGNVPDVYFYSDSHKVYVNWYNPRNANRNLRSRSEVSA